MNADMLNDIKKLAYEINNCKSDLGKLNLFFKYSNNNDLSIEKLEKLRIDMDCLINGEKVKFPMFIWVGFLILLIEMIIIPNFIGKLLFSLVFGSFYLVRTLELFKDYQVKKDILNKDKEEARLNVEEIKSIVKYRKGKVNAQDLVEEKEIYTINYFNNLIKFVGREIEGISGELNNVLRQAFSDIINNYEKVLVDSDILKTSIIRLGEIADTIVELKEGSYLPEKEGLEQLKIH